MTDTPYKQTFLGLDFEAPSSLALAHPSALLRPPVTRQARAQDTALAGRRIIVQRQMGGSADWLTDSSATGGGSQGHPDSETWRIIARARVDQQAGTILEARALCVPAGATEYDNTAGGTWDPDGVGGQTRVSLTWTNAAAQTANEVVTFTSGPAGGDGAEDTETGSAWAQLEHHYAAVVRPQDAPNSLSEADKWAEWPTVDAVVADLGGVRVVHFVLSEFPADHVVDDADVTSTANGAGTGVWPVKIPQIEQADGATYEEHRFGTHRALSTAARQTARVGPRIANWTSYTEADTGVADTEAVPVNVAGGVTARLSSGTNTVWDATAAGWDLLGTARAPEHLTSRVSGAGSIPVRVRIYLKRGATVGTVGVFRVQTSTRSFVEVGCDPIGTSYAWFTATGWLEAPVATDDGYPVLQDFLTTTNGDIDVRAWDVTYGDFAAAVP